MMGGMVTRHRSPSAALRRFGFRQTIKGAIIIGLITGLMMGAQGAAYAKAFPDTASREKLVTSLSLVSGINFLSGEVANAARPDSYAIYKSIAMMTLVTAAWGMLVTTRLLRGFEEDGRLELLQAGSVSRRRTSAGLLTGFAGSFFVAMMLTFLFVAGLGRDPVVALSSSGAAYMTLAVFMPGLCFAALGVMTSQLANTRARAVQYALILYVLFFVLRGSANSITSVDWLKKLSPFGWSDLLNPVLGVRPLWLLPTLIFSSVFTGLGLYWSGRRDLNEALLRRSDTVRSHYYLLRTPFQLAARQHIANAFYWGLGIVSYAAFFAALANFSTKLAGDSPAFKKAFLATSDNELKLLFIGAGTLLIATALLVMITVFVSAMRRDEAKSYLDNLLVQPVSRQRWLAGRLGLIALVFMIIALLSAVVTWAVARHINVELGLWAALATYASLAGVLALTLGVGAFFYGFWPRLAASAMSILIGWAFVVDILKSFFHLNSAITKTSILNYISLNPSATPDWRPISVLIAIGLVLAALGVARFGRRDIVSE